MSSNQLLLIHLLQQYKALLNMDHRLFLFNFIVALLRIDRCFARAFVLAILCFEFHGVTSTTNMKQPSVDVAYFIPIVVICTCLMLLIGLIIWFCLRNQQTYKRRRLPSKIHNNFPIETYTTDREGEFNIVEGQCLICISPFRDGDELCTLPVCRHPFHTKCIDSSWKRDCRCPVCKYDYLDNHI